VKGDILFFPQYARDYFREWIMYGEFWEVDKSIL